MNTISLGLRLPEYLREKLAAHARIHHRSLNGEVVSRLDQSFHSNTKMVDDLFDCVEIPRMVRIKSSSTSADATRILTIVKCLLVERLIFAARKCDLNNAVMVLIIETSHRTFLLDGSYLNMARTPRESEIRQIFQALDVLGLLDRAEYCEQLVPDTKHLAAEQAISDIAKAGRIKPLVKLSDYLNVLSQHGLFSERDFRAGDELSQ